MAVLELVTYVDKVEELLLLLALPWVCSLAPALPKCMLFSKLALFVFDCPS